MNERVNVAADRTYSAAILDETDEDSLWLNDYAYTFKYTSILLQVWISILIATNTATALEVRPEGKW